MSANSEYLNSAMELFENSNNHKDIGKLFGYPKCCFEAFQKCFSATSAADSEFRFLLPATDSARVSGQTEFLKIMSPQMDYRINSFFPCRFDCELAIAKALKRLDLLSKFDNWQPEKSKLKLSKFEIEFCL